ncbi:LysE family translocator [Lampropedia puyangensis]|uniref:LysE family translocator n=1 Tax=Lampropedia puyangensis TaxID=1330072 RepID=A0A4S8EYC3_9BURK|nr:LysE family translocator [Lampropedia puyangensis]THT99606.1 LysE family translocator [Lampropedia puyangensis]
MDALLLWLPMATFFFASSITPGPNNIMLASSGLNYGFRRSIPHMLGISVGCMAMIFVLGLGLGAAFNRLPVLHTGLKVVCVLYLLYLAAKIAFSGPMGAGQEQGKPMTFLQAAAFQWVNPKAWAMVLGVIAVYVPPKEFMANLLIATSIAGMVNLPTISVWTLFGVALKRWLREPRTVRMFNFSMAVLLVLSIYPMVV